METHAKVIGILLIVLGALSILGGLGVGAAFLFGMTRAFSEQARMAEERQRADQERQLAEQREEKRRLAQSRPAVPPAETERRDAALAREAEEAKKAEEARRADQERRRIALRSRMDETRNVMVTVFAVIGGIMVLVALGQILVGIGLLRRKGWARVAAIVLAFPMLLGIPIGTAIGIYILLMFFSPEAAEYFAA